MEHLEPLVLDPADCRYLWRLHLRLAWRYFTAYLEQKAQLVLKRA